MSQSINLLAFIGHCRGSVTALFYIYKDGVSKANFGSLLLPHQAAVTCTLFLKCQVPGSRTSTVCISCGTSIALRTRRLYKYQVPLCGRREVPVLRTRKLLLQDLRRIVARGSF